MLGTEFKAVRKMRVAVIGAGICGLYSIKACLDQYLEPICYEQQGHIGGYLDEVTDDVQSLNQRYNLYHFSDYLDRDNAGIAPTVEHYYKYLYSYASHYNLDSHVQLNHQVLSIEKHSKSRKSKWRLKIKNNGITFWEDFDKVMVCCGRQESVFKRWSREREAGMKMVIRDDSQLNDWSEAEGKEVLMIGDGRRTEEVLIRVTRYAKQVWLSTERPTSLRCTDGTQHCLSSRAQTSHDPLDFLTSTGAMDDALPAMVMSGKVVVKPRIVTVTDDDVTFADDSTLRPEMVYCTSGYETGFPFLNRDILGDTPSNTVYKFVFPSTLDHPDLAFIGCFLKNMEMYTGHYEVQARWAVHVFKGNVKHPSREEMQLYLQSRRTLFEMGAGSADDTAQLEVPLVVHCDYMAAQIGCLPSIWRLAVTDPYLAFVFWFGVPHSCHYRLVGPNGCIQARDNAIDLYKQWTRNNPSSGNWKRWLRIALIAILTTALAAGIWHAGPYPGVSH